MITKEQFEARDTIEENKGFENFMNRSTTRLLLSMIPSAEGQDTLKTLLQEAHSQGWNSGGANMMVMMLESIFKDPRFRG